jgi:hypothetical protein
MLQRGDDLVGHLPSHCHQLLLGHVVHREEIAVLPVEGERVDLDDLLLADQATPLRARALPR